MGIDIPSLISAARHGMWAAGLAPARLAQIVGNAERNEGSQSANPKEFAAAIARMSETQGIEFPLDLPEADVLVTLSAGTIESDGAEVAAIHRILTAAGYTYTFSTYGYEATNFGMLSGYNYQAVVPSTWNAGPRALHDPKQPLEIQRTVHSFDPCLACAVHVLDEDGEEQVRIRVR